MSEWNPIATETAQTGEVRVLPVRHPDPWMHAERALSLWSILEFFPRDAISMAGRPGSVAPPARPLTIETDLGFEFETEIAYPTWTFRLGSPREPSLMRWCRECGLEPGDQLVFTRLGERRYRLSLLKGEPSE